MIPLRSLNKSILIIVLLLFIFILTFVLIITSPKKSAPTPSSSGGIPTFSNPPSTDTTSGKIYPELRAVIGKTTVSDIKKLPNIKSEQPIANNQVQYSFSSPLIARDDLVITDGAVVISERLISVEDNLTHPKLSDFKSKYGQPETTREGHKFYGKFETTYIWASKGFVLIANPFTEEVDEIQTFQPTSVDRYLGSSLGQEIEIDQPDQEDFSR